MKKLDQISLVLEDINKNSVTPDEFAENFELVISFVKDTYQITQTELEKLHSMFVEAVTEMKSGIVEYNASQKAKLLVQCEEYIHKLDKKNVDKFTQLDLQIKEIKDSKQSERESIIEETISRIDALEEPEEPEETPREVADFLNQEEEIIEQETIIGLVKRLNDLENAITRKNMTNVIGGATGGGRLVKVHDLTSQLDGVTKTFALPAFWQVISVHSSSFPNIFRPTTDFTVDASAMTITFTSEITADATLATGQTLLVVYAEA